MPRTLGLTKSSPCFAGCLSCSPLSGRRPLAASPATPRVSGFNRCSGYSAAVYDGWARSSRYVTVRDGTRLAVDVFRLPLPVGAGGHGAAGRASYVELPVIPGKP
jgi:predicted acyl esterase